MITNDSPPDPKVATLLTLLKPLERVALLHYLKGASYCEIALEFGPGANVSNVSRYMTRIREKYERVGLKLPYRQPKKSHPKAKEEAA